MSEISYYKTVNYSFQMQNMKPRIKLLSWHNAGWRRMWMCGVSTMDPYAYVAATPQEAYAGWKANQPVDTKNKPR